MNNSSLRHKAKTLLIVGIVFSGLTMFLLAMFLPFLGFFCILLLSQECGDTLITILTYSGVIAGVSFGGSGIVYLLSRGKSIVALSGALIIIALIGAGYSWFGGKGEISKEDQDQLVSASWKTFTSELEGYSLKYPEDWDLSVERPIDGSYERVFLSGPNNFALSIRAHNFPRGWEGGEQYNVLTVSENQNGPNGTIWIYAAADMSGEGPRMGVTDYKLTAGPTNAILSAGFDGRHLNAVQVYGSYQSPDETISPQEFISKPEVIIAEEILRSLTYNQ